MLPVKSDAGVMPECTHSTDQSVHDCDTAQNRMGDLSRSNATAFAGIPPHATLVFEIEVLSVRAGKSQVAASPA